MLLGYAEQQGDFSASAMGWRAGLSAAEGAHAGIQQSQAMNLTGKVQG